MCKPCEIFSIEFYTCIYFEFCAIFILGYFFKAWLFIVTLIVIFGSFDLNFLSRIVKFGQAHTLEIYFVISKREISFGFLVIFGLFVFLKLTFQSYTLDVWKQLLIVNLYPGPISRPKSLHFAIFRQSFACSDPIFFLQFPIIGRTAISHFFIF